MPLQTKSQVTLLDAGDFTPNDESPFAGMTPDQRHHHIEDVGRAAEFADYLIQTLQTSDDATRDVHDMLEAMDLMNSSANENFGEESPTSDRDVDDDRTVA